MNTDTRKIILFNPRSAEHGHRLPISILQIGASIYGIHDFVIVDGNLERDPWGKIYNYLKTGEFGFFAVTVMPGPQLKQAILVTRSVKFEFPQVISIWGGYFPSNHTEVCMQSGYIDYIIRGPGDLAFPELLDCIFRESFDRLINIRNLAYKVPGGKVVANPMGDIPDQDSLPSLPFEHLGHFYPIEKYIVKTFIGSRTLMYHSSLGCPHDCSFCGVAGIYNQAWKGKSAQKMVAEILELKNKYGIDAIEILDSNFFASKTRIVEFCRLMAGEGIQWWAEGRVDSLGSYTDEALTMIRNAGCRLVFMGAETGNNTLLNRVNKGGTQSSEVTEELIGRFRESGIIPELSFVLGFPEENQEAVDQQAREDIQFITKLLKINPGTEIVLYLFSPIPSYHSQLFELTLLKGFSFPERLEDWLKPEWENFDLRRGIITPWLLPGTVRRIRNFETVLAAAFPGASNSHIHPVGKLALKIIGRFRYHTGWYSFPLVLKILLKLFSYQRPEKEGFYSE